MRKILLQYIFVFLALWMTGCQDTSNVEFIPALPTLEELTPTTTYRKLTQADLCGFVAQEEFRLGKTTERAGIEWLKSMGYEVVPSKYAAGAYSISPGNQSFYVVFYDDVLVGGESSQVQTVWTFGDVVANLGSPDKVYGRPMWTFGCEGTQCAYNVGLLYLKNGVMVESSGTERNPIWMENDIAGIAINPDMAVKSIICFLPGKLDTYLAHAYSSPVKIKQKHLHDWKGFDMVIPLLP